MNPQRLRIVTFVLVAAVVCASVGCASEPPMRHPTHETFTTYLQAGDEVEVVLKEGTKRKFTITRLDADAAWGEPAMGPCSYADMVSVRAVSRAAPAGDWKGGTTHEWRTFVQTAQVAGLAVVVVVAVPVVIVGGMCGLGRLAAASRSW